MQFRVLTSAATTANRPNPNTLATVSPYATTTSLGRNVSAAWVSQGAKMLLPLGVQDGGGDRAAMLAFEPSGGDTITYTVVLWRLILEGGTFRWIKPGSNSQLTYTGPVVDYIQLPGKTPWFIQVSSIASGTLKISCDLSLAEAL